MKLPARPALATQAGTGSFIHRGEVEEEHYGNPC
jgi:hypothetical protein